MTDKSCFYSTQNSLHPPYPSTKPSKKSLIVGAVVGSIVFLIMITIVVVCRRQRMRKKPLKVGKRFEGVTFTAVSLRDRIRAESMRALDESKILSLFNSDDIYQTISAQQHRVYPGSWISELWFSFLG